jgi:hypothetical protein
MKAGGYCPYYSLKLDLCLAALFYFAVDRAREECVCGTEDFDECPLFLSKILRSKSVPEIETGKTLAN